MNNKYTKTLQSYASALDILSPDAEGFFTKMIVSIIECDDDTSCKRVCEELAKVSKSNNTKLKHAAVALKDSMIAYYGHKRISEICNPQNDNYKEDKSIDELLSELNNLVGLKNVKDKVNDLIAFQTVRKKREEIGLISHNNTLHMAFTGNPGTGKTTVARIVGRIYKQLGFLSKGHFVEVSRTDLIAGYQGQTALKVKEVINKSKGGVLFIDEAYSITENDHSDSYGRECLTELTKALEDYRDDLVVIVAGYTEPMELFFESNPGLKSRFNCFIEFDDYNEKELMEILEKLCDENMYKLSENAREKADEIVQNEIKNKKDKFANGRLIRNIYEDMVMNQARRVYSIGEMSEHNLITIEEDDVSSIL